MPRIQRREKEKQRKITRERIDYLMDLADKAAYLGNLKLANDYVKMARNLGMRHRVRLPAEHKRRFCKYCYSYLKPNISSKVRINSAERRVEIKCLNCGRVMIFPYGREKKERRRKGNEERQKRNEER